MLLCSLAARSLRACKERSVMAEGGQAEGKEGFVYKLGE